jgi:hypothetical protein
MADTLKLRNLAVTGVMSDSVRRGNRRELRSPIDRDAMLRVALAAICLAVPCSASADEDVEFHSTYYGGMGEPKYEYKITAEMIDRAPKWNERVEPNPPLSAAVAIIKGKECIEKIPTGSIAPGPTPENYWELTGVGLKKVLRGWAWDVSYQLTSRGPMSGIWPIMDCWVLMDGTVLAPTASTQGIRLQH